jgi:hypothetical protein
MLGPRSRSAAKRAPRAEQVQDEQDGDDERAPKRPKEAEQSRVQAEALAASKLYAIVSVVTSENEQTSAKF